MEDQNMDPIIPDSINAEKLISLKYERSGFEIYYNAVFEVASTMKLSDLQSLVQESENSRAWSTGKTPLDISELKTLEELVHHFCSGSLNIGYGLTKFNTLEIEKARNSLEFNTTLPENKIKSRFDTLKNWLTSLNPFFHFK